MKGKNETGFSLVEVMCAILVLGIAVAGLTQGLTTALRSSKESERQTIAAMLAAGQIETLRAEGYLTDGDTEGQGSDALSAYRWKQSVTSAGLDGLHDVSVRVDYAPSGETIYELRTLLFEAPLAASSNTNSPAGSLRSKNARAKGRR